MVVKRGDVSGGGCWRGLPTRALVFEKQKYAPEHKSSKEHLVVTCCGNAFGNHRLKFVATGEANKSTAVQGY
jgi:hypothetical protein